MQSSLVQEDGAPASPSRSAVSSSFSKHSRTRLSIDLPQTPGSGKIIYGEDEAADVITPSGTRQSRCRCGNVIVHNDEETRAREQYVDSMHPLQYADSLKSRPASTVAGESADGSQSSVFDRLYQNRVTQEMNRRTLVVREATKESRECTYTPRTNSVRGGVLTPVKGSKHRKDYLDGRICKECFNTIELGKSPVRVEARVKSKSVRIDETSIRQKNFLRADDSKKTLKRKKKKKPIAPSALPSAEEDKISEATIVTDIEEEQPEDAILPEEPGVSHHDWNFRVVNSLGATGPDEPTLEEGDVRTHSIYASTATATTCSSTTGASEDAMDTQSQSTARPRSVDTIERLRAEATMEIDDSSSTLEMGSPRMNGVPRIEEKILSPDDEFFQQVSRNPAHTGLNPVHSIGSPRSAFVKLITPHSRVSAAKENLNPLAEEGAGTSTIENKPEGGDMVVHVVRDPTDETPDIRRREKIVTRSEVGVREPITGAQLVECTSSSFDETIVYNAVDSVKMRNKQRIRRIETNDTTLSSLAVPTEVKMSTATGSQQNTWTVFEWVDCCCNNGEEVEVQADMKRWSS